MNLHYADYNVDLRLQKIQCYTNYNNYDARFMSKYYAEFVGSSNQLCFTEHSENGKTFPNLFLPLLAVKKVKNNRAYLNFFQISRSANFCVQPFLKPLHWNPFFSMVLNGLLWISLNMFQILNLNNVNVQCISFPRNLQKIFKGLACLIWIG